MARSKSKSSTRRGLSISPVRSKRSGRVVGFMKMVPIVRRDGTRSKAARFLPKTKWPRSKSVLRRLGVKETLSQIEKNNLSNLRKGRSKRRANTTKTRSKSTRKSRSKSMSKRSTRKSTRRSSRRPGKEEAAFRRHYYNRSKDQSSTSPTPTPLVPPSPTPSKKISTSQYTTISSDTLDMAKRGLKKTGASVTRSSKRRQRRSARRSRRSAKRSMRKQRRSARRSARKSRRSSKRLSRKSHQSARKQRRSARRSARKSRRSARRSMRKQRRSSVSMKGASVVKGAAARKSKTSDWSHKKNLKLKAIMRRDYGRVLTKEEFMRLPSEVRTEMQKQAYERAYPEFADKTPERLLSKEAQAKRAEKREKARRSKSLSRSGRKIRSYQEPHSGPRGSYKGAEQAIRDFVEAYERKYPDRQARMSAMRRDLNNTKDRLVDPERGYDHWKNAPWDYDLRGVDTAESDDEFYEKLKVKKGASVRRHSRKTKSHSKSKTHSKSRSRHTKSRHSKSKSHSTRSKRRQRK